MSKYTKYQLENKVNIAEKYWLTTTHPKGYITFQISTNDICEEYNFKNRTFLVGFIKDLELFNNFKCNLCSKEYLVKTRTEAYALFNMDCPCKLPKKQENNSQNIINRDDDNFIDGAYIKGFRIINNNISANYYWIKLSEIKTIVPGTNNESYFSTYKDSTYFAQCSDHSLRLLINTFLFNTEEYVNSFAKDYKTK